MRAVAGGRAGGASGGLAAAGAIAASSASSTCWPTTSRTSFLASRTAFGLLVTRDFTMPATVASSASAAATLPVAMSPLSVAMKAVAKRLPASMAAEPNATPAWRAVSAC